MTVEADETIPLQYEASDDYGLAEIRLIARTQGRKGKPFSKDIQSVPGDLRNFSGRSQLDLAEIGVQPGDTISLYLEATDNNNTSGAQVGRSITRILTVFSEVKHHRELLKKYENLLWSLVDGLAKELEQTVIAFRYDENISEEKKEMAKQATMIQNEAEIVKTMNNLLAESRLDRYDIEALTQALSNAHKDLNRWVTTKQRTIDRVGASHQLDKRSTASAWGLLLSQNRSLTQALEKHVLYFDDLINTQRLNEAH